MNKLSKPASNCRTAKLITTHGNANQGGADSSRPRGPGILFVYERSCARAGNLSSVVGTEKRRCRIKIQLPAVAVHKSGKRFCRGMPSLHVCMQTVSSQGFRAV